MDSKAHVSDVVRKLVADAGEILGSKLAMELKAAVPDWNAADYGAQSLRDFIVTDVQGVGVTGRSGMDVIYSYSPTHPVEAPPPKSSPSSDAWRAWISPNSPLALAINTVDGAVVLVKRTAIAPEGHTRIEPTTPGDHRAIALEFLDRIPEAAHDHMLRLAESPHDHWWRGWFAGLKKLGEHSSWAAFRQERLRELLKARLDAAGLDESAKTAAAGAVVRSRQSRPSTPRRSISRKHVGIRGVVVAVIDRMRDEELRDLKLPVGLVVDVLADTKS